MDSGNNEKPVEFFDIYSPDGVRIGRAPRSQCHGNPALLHRSAQIFVYDSCGRMLLQKRSADKDIQPGRWDTSVGGHLRCGEDYHAAAVRELTEELGLPPEKIPPLEHLFDISIRNEIESEDVRVYRIVSDGPFSPQRSEIDEVRFFLPRELEDPVRRRNFTPNLIRELELLKPADVKTPDLRGIVDVGAHSVKLEIFQLSGAGGFESFDTFVKPVNLGSDILKTGNISAPSINLLCGIMHEFASRLTEYGDIPVRAVATSALREASNRELVIDRVRRASGIAIEILEAQEEARLLYLAVRESLEAAGGFPEHRTLFFAVGTGSLIVMYADGGRLQFSEPVPLGSMRFADEYSDQHLSAKRIATLLGNFCVEQRLSNSTNFDPRRPMTIVGLGAGVRALVGTGAYDVSPGDDVLKLAPGDFDRIIGRAQTLTVDSLIHDFRMSESEAESVVPTAVIAEYFLRELNCREAIFPAVTTRSALMAEALRPVGEDPFKRDLMTVAANIAHKYAADTRHAGRVAGFALGIFDAVASEAALTGRMRTLLEIACRLHDVGRFVDVRQHHRHSAYLIENAQLPGITDRERRIIAMIARYHRREVPGPGQGDFAVLPEEERVTVLKLSAIIRIADSLAGGDLPPAAVKMTAAGGKLILSVRRSADFDCGWENMTLTRKSELFEIVYGLKPVLRRREAS